jgi:hypothetical protein
MSATNEVKTSWGATMVLAIVAGLGVFTAAAPLCNAQSQVAHEEVPAAVANELQTLKAEIGQLESKVDNLTATVMSSTSTTVQQTRTGPTEVTLTGTVSCGHCQGIPPVHKNDTPFSWALYSVSQGDDIVLVASDKTYKLHGDKDTLLKLMCDRAKVTGRLESATLEVETIARAPKKK